MSLTRAFIFCILPFVAYGQPIPADELRVSNSEYRPPQGTVLRAATRIVEVPVVVRDKQGKVIPGLTREDFAIRDSGKKRDLVGFSIVTKATAAPEPSPSSSPKGALPSEKGAAATGSAMALMLDDRNTTIEQFLRARDAADAFLVAGLPPGRSIALATVRRGFVTKFLSSAEDLRVAVRQLNPQPNLPPSSSCPTFSPYTAFVVANNRDRNALEAKVVEYYSCNPQLYNATPPKTVMPDQRDAVDVIAVARRVWQEQAAMSKETMGSIRNAVRTLARQPGKRTLLLASTGFYAGTLLELQQDVITEAVRESVVIDALDSKGLFVGDDGGGSARTFLGRAAIYEQAVQQRALEASNDVAVNLTASTGGRLYRGSNDLTRGYTQLAAEPEVTYLLAFVPSAIDGKFHPLKVDLVKTKNATVEARLGYVSEKDDAGEPPPIRRIDTEVFTETAAHEVPLDVRVGYEAGNPSLAVRAVFGVNLRKTKLVERSGRRHQTLRFIVAVLDPDGNFVLGKEGAMEFALSSATYERISATRLDASLSLEVPPGAYRLRVIAEEQNGGGLTTATQEIHVP